MRGKDDLVQMNVVREYRNLLSCEELIQRIIRYHNTMGEEDPLPEEEQENREEGTVT